MKWNSPLQIKIAILALTLLSLFSLVEILFNLNLSAWAVSGRDQVSRFEKRLQPLKLRLLEEKAVNYLGDHSDNTSHQQQLNFQLTQYALAPMMVTDKRKSKYVVCVLPLDPLLEKEIDEQGLTLVNDFGSFVRLFERRSP